MRSGRRELERRLHEIRLERRLAIASRRLVEQDDFREFVAIVDATARQSAAIAQSLDSSLDQIRHAQGVAWVCGAILAKADSDHEARLERLQAEEQDVLAAIERYPAESKARGADPDILQTISQARSAK